MIKFIHICITQYAKPLGIETTGKWYKHMPKPVYEEGDVPVLWKQAVHTEKLQQTGQM
jgi:hypothetical protein